MESQWDSQWTISWETYQKLDQLSQQNNITEEPLCQYATRSETLRQPTNYVILGPGIDLIFADMFPGIYNAMPVDMKNTYLVSNTGAPRAPNVEPSTITFVQFWPNEWHVFFHAEKNSMLHNKSLESVFDDASHIHLLNRRHSQFRRQWLRAKSQ